MLLGETTFPGTVVPPGRKKFPGVLVSPVRKNFFRGCSTPGRKLFLVSGSALWAKILSSGVPRLGYLKNVNLTMKAISVKKNNQQNVLFVVNRAVIYIQNSCYFESNKCYLCQNSCYLGSNKCYLSRNSCYLGTES